MRTPLLVALVLLVTTIAGCIEAGEDDDGGDGPETPAIQIPADWHERALAHTGDHDHAVAAHHVNRTTANFQEIGYDPLTTDYFGAGSGSNVCGDVSETGERRIGVVHSFTSDVALVVVDLTDPMMPQKVGELVLPQTFVYDVAITPDGKYAVLGTSDPDAQREKTPVAMLVERAWPIPDPFGGRAYFRDACTGEQRPIDDLRRAAQGPLDEVPFGSGVVLVDLSTPEEPVVADYHPLPVLGAHSVFLTELDGAYVLLASVTNLQQQASYYQFFTISETPVATKLVSESVYEPTPPEGTEQAVINGHVDGWIMKHPVSGVPTAFLANWDGGLIILDVSNLKVPEEQGRWTNFREVGDIPYDDDSGSIHEALPAPVTWGGRHYTFIGQEIIGRPDATPSGVIHAMDTTDPTNPHPVSAWTIPADPVWDDDLLYSTHYVTLQNTTLFVAMYHGGVWAVDYANVTEPRSAGVFVPANTNPRPAPDEVPNDLHWEPVVLEVEAIGNGRLVVWDGYTGVYTVQYDESVLVPEVDEWDVAF